MRTLEPVFRPVDLKVAGCLLRSRWAMGFVAIVLTIGTFVCAATAFQVLGPESNSLLAQVLGASPTFTIFQYVEAFLAVLFAFSTCELGCLALTGHYLPLPHRQSRSFPRAPIEVDV